MWAHCWCVRGILPRIQTIKWLLCKNRFFSLLQMALLCHSCLRPFTLILKFCRVNIQVTIQGQITIQTEVFVSVKMPPSVCNFDECIFFFTDSMLRKKGGYCVVASVQHVMHWYGKMKRHRGWGCGEESKQFHHNVLQKYDTKINNYSSSRWMGQFHQNL